MRLNQYLARAGVASRRKADLLIANGEINVNGKVASDLGTQIEPERDIVMYKGCQIKVGENKFYLLNKPTGYTCTRSDRHAERTIYELLPKDSSLFSVGRLDRDTSGLLLVTNDGDWAQRIIHPSKKIEKEYRVGLARPITDQDVRKLTAGVMLDDGPANAMRVTIIDNATLALVIEEGRKRIVRRMFAAVGNKVVKLERTRIGNYLLDVPGGKYRSLTTEEVGEYA